MLAISKRPRERGVMSKSLIGQVGLDAGILNNGYPVQIGEITIRIYSPFSPEFKRRFAKLMDEFKAIKNPTTEQVEEYEKRRLAALVAGWDNLEYGLDGEPEQPLIYSEENAYTVLSDPRLSALQTIVDGNSRNLDNYRKEVKEDGKKNSRRSSRGS